MAHKVRAYMFAGLAVAVIGGGILWAIGTEKPRASASIETKTFGPSNETYLFMKVAKGKDGPLGGCVVCHGLKKGDPVRAAPGLHGIVGAPKAAASWFGYSTALATAGGTWTVEELDKYLTKPSAFLPGTKKTLVGIPDAEARKQIIDELARLTD